MGGEALLGQACWRPEVGGDGGCWGVGYYVEDLEGGEKCGFELRWSLLRRCDGGEGGHSWRGSDRWVLRKRERKTLNILYPGSRNEMSVE